MSIFDRLISTLTGGDEAVSPVPEKTPTVQSEEKRPRFMGREGGQSQVQPVVEKGFEGPCVIWLHVQPTTQRLLLVSDLGVAAGQELTAKMTADLLRAGICEEVAYHAGYDQYWKMPSQEAILRTPSLYDIPTPLMHKIKLETKLVKQGEPRGFWMQVRIRSNEELAGASSDAT